MCKYEACSDEWGNQHKQWNGRIVSRLAAPDGHAVEWTCSVYGNIDGWMGHDGKERAAIEALTTNIWAAQGGLGCVRHMNVPYAISGGQSPAWGIGWEQSLRRC